MDADGGKADRSFEPQIHADGRGWGKVDRTFEPQIHADGRGWGGRAIALLLTTDGRGLSAWLEGF